MASSLNNQVCETEKLMVVQLFNKYTAFNKVLKFITTCTTKPSLRSLLIQLPAAAPCLSAIFPYHLHIFVLLTSAHTFLEARRSLVLTFPCWLLVLPNSFSFIFITPIIKVKPAL
jgi:hypothetical protein